MPHCFFVMPLFPAHFANDGRSLVGGEIPQMSYPQNSPPNVIRRVGVREAGHCGISNSVRNDEIDLGIRELLDIACEPCDRRIENRLESVTAATVQSVAGGAMFHVHGSGRPQIIWRRRQGICPRSGAASDPSYQDISGQYLFKATGFLVRCPIELWHHEKPYKRGDRNVCRKCRRNPTDKTSHVRNLFSTRGARRR